MKIQQNCGVVGKQTIKDLETGTVFKNKGSSVTWLKTTVGYLHLSNNSYYRAIPDEFNESVEVDLTYPNARIVLE